MTRYVTEIYEPNREPPELQVLRSYPKAEPQVKAEAAQLGGSGPRPISTREDRSMSTSTLWAPTREELDRVTARTAAAMADPSVSTADRARLAELEERAHHEYLRRPGADAELQRDAERELREYEMEAGS
jgi:hypothetical protein